ncbi:MAG: hypothetical protein M5U29_02885 [Anaerolineae bacterium]|nr:hypothetical protein [Anaerolineae bacterium]
MTRLRHVAARDDLIVLVVAAIGVLLYVAAALQLSDSGYPLDDAWIHQTYAHNLAERGEWAFVPGQPSSASTAPLYSLLLAGAYLLRVSHFAWTFALGALSLSAAGWISARLAGHLWPDVGGARLWTGVLVALSWHLVWAAASGMETMLFAALALALIWATWADAAAQQGPSPRQALLRGARTGVVSAALTLTRPEGVALVGLAVLLRAATAGRDGWRWRSPAVMWIAGLALSWAAICAPAAALNWHLSGTLLPDTAAAKQAEYAPISERWSLPERYARMIAPMLAGHLSLALPGLLAGCAGVVQRARQDGRALIYALPLLWAALHVSAYGLRLPANYQHGRYVMPVLPALLVFGVGGTLTLVQRARRSAAGRVLSRSLALALLLVTGGFWIIGARQYGADVRIINTEMVATARWVKANLAEDDLLAVHDIGAVGYFAPRPIFDLAGLVSPEIVPLFRDGEAIMRLMCSRGVAYLMVMPDQRPVPPDDPRLGGAPIFITGAPYAPAAGGGNMAVYRLEWPAGCVW